MIYELAEKVREGSFEGAYKGRIGWHQLDGAKLFGIYRDARESDPEDPKGTGSVLLLVTSKGVFALGAIKESCETFMLTDVRNAPKDYSDLTIKHFSVDYESYYRPDHHPVPEELLEDDGQIDYDYDVLWTDIHIHTSEGVIKLQWLGYSNEGVQVYPKLFMIDEEFVFDNNFTVKDFSSWDLSLL